MLSNLASVETDLSRLDEAARLYERALTVLEKRSSESVDRIRTLQMQLAELYLESGQTAVADKLLRRIVGSDASQLQTPTPGAAYVLDVLACLYAQRGKFANPTTRTHRR